MAVAEIIGAAIGVLLLVVVAYLLVGGTLSAAETVVTAQKDMTLMSEARLRTSITISDVVIDGTNLSFSITNNGNEVVTDLPHMDIFSYNRTNGYTQYTYDSQALRTEGTWYVVTFEKDYIHARQLDPGVTLKGIAVLEAGDIPVDIRAITSNGVSASAAI